MGFVFNSGLERRTPLRPNKSMKRSGIKRSLRPMKKVGKKAALRERINRPNRIRFAEMGLLNVCEAKLPGCWPNGRLTWAHGKKDRMLTMEERKNLVIRCCTVCHHRLDEEFSHAEMLAFVQDVIETRAQHNERVNNGINTERSPNAIN